MEKRNNCLGCTERHLGCHADCEIYLAYRKELDKIDEARKKRNEEKRLALIVKQKNINHKLREKGKLSR